MAPAVNGILGARLWTVGLRTTPGLRPARLWVTRLRAHLGAAGLTTMGLGAAGAQRGYLITRRSARHELLVEHPLRKGTPHEAGYPLGESLTDGSDDSLRNDIVELRQGASILPRPAQHIGQ